MHPGKKSYADQTFFSFSDCLQKSYHLPPAGSTHCPAAIAAAERLERIIGSSSKSALQIVLIAVLHPRPLSHADQDFLFHPANLHLADTEFLGDLGLRLILVVAQPDQDFFLFGKLVYKLF